MVEEPLVELVGDGDHASQVSWGQSAADAEVAGIVVGRDEVLARDLLLDIVLPGAHLRDLVLGFEPLDRVDVLASDPPQALQARESESRDRAETG